MTQQPGDMCTKGKKKIHLQIVGMLRHLKKKVVQKLA